MPTDDLASSREKNQSLQEGNTQPVLPAKETEWDSMRIRVKRQPIYRQCLAQSESTVIGGARKWPPAFESLFVNIMGIDCSFVKDDSKSLV